MTCVICKNGDTKPGFTSVTLERGVTTVHIKRVPADICENCGEYYLSEGVTGRVLELAESAVEQNVEFEVIRFAA